MSILNVALQLAVEKYIDGKYQSLIISNVSPVVNVLATEENIVLFVRKIASILDAQDDLASMWLAVSGMKTEDQVTADAQANLEESAAMVSKNTEVNKAIGTALTNIFSGALLIGLGVAKVAI